MKIDPKISPDKMKAFLTLRASKAAFPTKNGILDALQSAGIVNGIDSNLVAAIARDKKSVTDLPIAAGTAPVGGQNGKLVWHVDPQTSNRPRIDENGKADYWGMKKICQIAKGEEIVSMLPPTNGKPGKTVTGQVIHQKGHSVSLPRGENVALSDDGLSLIADMDGHVEYRDGKVSVQDVYHIAGDVDFSTGNIKYKGKVHIQGDVRSGFRVEARDSITIEGNVEAAHIYSRSGDVFIGLGIVGKGKANILAGGNFACGYVQDAAVNASGDILIRRYAINSHIYAGKKIIINENEGLIRGGKMYCQLGIDALEIGSPRKIPTEVGLEGYEASTEDSQIRTIQQKEKSIHTELNVLKKKEKFLQLLRLRLDGLSTEKQRELDSTVKKIADLETRIASLQEEKSRLKTDTDQKRPQRAITVRGDVHQGVLVSIGQLKYFIEQLYTNIIIYRKLNEIVLERMR